MKTLNTTQDNALARMAKRLAQKLRDSGHTELERVQPTDNEELTVNFPRPRVRKNNSE